MSCPYCQSNWFWKKIGRCKRCMIQLFVLSVLGWGSWWLLFADNPKSVEAVALLLLSVACNSLLALHLIKMVWLRMIKGTQ
ncbi:DUF3624 domain-containing protein [Vibrio maerlii]|uniref:DUF3624 domain-containing protein n=1 Tax=Vibrio maerlii TaxID=2231648 RepID=UPI000E3D7C30|nr:DUF3624 domain-containing protein [Vibrio maerlii]